MVEDRRSKDERHSRARYGNRARPIACLAAGGLTHSQRRSCWSYRSAAAKPAAGPSASTAASTPPTKFLWWQNIRKSCAQRVSG